MEEKICQSCGMPLQDDVLGTNKDGSKNEEYCLYCYQNGEFKSNCTMEEMIEFCVQPMLNEEKDLKGKRKIKRCIEKPELSSYNWIRLWLIFTRCLH